MLRLHISQRKLATGFNSLSVEMQENIVWNVSGGNVRKYEAVCEFTGIEKYFYKRSD